MHHKRRVGGIWECRQCRYFLCRAPQNRFAERSAEPEWQSASIETHIFCHDLKTSEMPPNRPVFLLMRVKAYSSDRSSCALTSLPLLGPYGDSPTANELGTVVEAYPSCFTSTSTSTPSSSHPECFFVIGDFGVNGASISPAISAEEGITVERQEAPRCAPLSTFWASQPSISDEVDP